MSNAKLSNSASVDNESLVLIVNSTGTGDTAVADSPYRMNTPNCVVGSGPKANWVISNADLKPEHAELVRLSCGAYVRGLDAPNDKLLVNGEPVSESWIHSGDRLTMGKMELLVEAIGKIEFGSCDKLESLIFRTTRPSSKTIAQEQDAASAPCINYMPVATSENTADVEVEETETTDCLSNSLSESDSKPWFLVDSLVDDIEKYECESANVDVQVNEDSDSQAVVETTEQCEMTSEIELQVTQADSPVSELDEATDVDDSPVAQDSSATTLEHKSVESEEPCFHDADLDDILDDMSDPCFEMPVETEAVEPGEQPEPDTETVFQIPRIDTEASDDFESTDADEEPVANPVRSMEDQQGADSEVSTDTDSIAVASGRLSEDSADDESSCESGDPESEFLSDEHVSVMTRQNDYSSEQASWLNELYDSIIPDEHDNAGTPVAGKRDDANEESVEPEAQIENSSWLSNRPFDLSGLMKPGVDPESVSSLPDTNDKHAAELFSKFDSIDHVSDIAHENEFEPESMEAESMEAESMEAESTSDDDSLASNMLNAEIDEEVESESVVAAEPPAPAPSVAEVLEQMRQSGEVALDFDDDPQPSTPDLNEATETPSTTAPEGEQKDDVNDYMSQLMNRLRGGTPAPEPTKSAEKAKAGVAPVQPAKRTSKNDIDDLAPENPLKADEYVSKSTLPEKPGNLTALRQIANQSVQTAIQRSLQNKNQNSSTMYLAGSGFAFFLSVVLFIMSSGWFDLAFIAASISSIACAMSGYMFISVNNGLEKLLEYRKQKQDDQPDNKPEEPATDQATN